VLISRSFKTPAILLNFRNKYFNHLNPDTMEEDPTLIDTLFKKITEFGLTYFELLKLKAVDRITAVVSSVLPDLVVSILMIVFLLFLNIGAAFWLGDLLGNTCYGFLIIGAFYFFLGFIFHFFIRDRIKKAALNYLIKRIFR
jgi:hypothetical protein